MADRPAASLIYREQAARLRALAHDSKSATLRSELLDVAAQFERLADLAERPAARDKNAKPPA